MVARRLAAASACAACAGAGASAAAGNRRGSAIKGGIGDIGARILARGSGALAGRVRGPRVRA
ncbi:MAG: hypothetical protein KJ018_03695, partial [Burkholderiales bacterium]|nr:hypothetical protein [Burkholderiales bacterium]